MLNCLTSTNISVWEWHQIWNGKNKLSVFYYCLLAISCSRQLILRFRKPEMKLNRNWNTKKNELFCTPTLLHTHLLPQDTNWAPRQWGVICSPALSQRNILPQPRICFFPPNSLVQRDHRLYYNTELCNNGYSALSNILINSCVNLVSWHIH